MSARQPVYKPGDLIRQVKKIERFAVSIAACEPKNRYNRSRTIIFYHIGEQFCFLTGWNLEFSNLGNCLSSLSPHKINKSPAKTGVVEVECRNVFFPAIVHQNKTA